MPSAQFAPCSRPDRGAGRLGSILAALLLAIVLGSAFAPAFAQAPQPANPLRQRLDGLRTELTQIERVFTGGSATDAELQRQRARLQPLAEQLRGIVEEQAPRTEQAKLGLEQLGAKPDAKGPAETGEVARERQQRETQFAEADETLKIARAALLQAEQLQTSISDRRRELFARALFAPGPSVLSPDVWSSAAGSIGSDIRASQLIFGDWFSRVSEQLYGPRGALLGLSLVAALLLYVIRARYLPMFKARLARSEKADALRQLYVACAHVVAGAAPPALASWLVYSALNTTGLLPPRIQPIIFAIVIGLAIFAFVQALSDALFAPATPQRRLVSVYDSTARVIVWISCALAAVIGVAKVIEACLQAIAAGLPISILARGILSILFGATLIFGLSRLRVDEEEDAKEEACLGPYVPVDGAHLGPVRIIGWIVGFAIIAAVLLGYGVFASFLTEQVIWIGILAALYVLLEQLLDLGIPSLLTGRGRLATTLRSGVGFKAATLEKIAIILTGVLKIVLIVIAILLALAPWGLESADFFTSLRAAFFGFQVGGVTVSLSSIIVCVLFFAAGLTATRTLQRWLDSKFLPSTRLDPGLRNSIVTAAGYFGTIAALALAVSAVGLSLERLTLVASALSVGIGFGLQSVVSNFVSGLILLWERPIRVGDQVVVGDAEGIVKRINVRSTEIETFDRSSVIVPNSNLVSGVVRNRVRTDRVGRVLIALSVPRSIDPGDVRDMLMGAAEKHGDVLKTPAPSVQFKKLGSSTSDFELICFVADVSILGRVTSDLNFVIHKRLAEIEPAAGPSELKVSGLDGIEGAIAGIAGAIDRNLERAPPRRAQPRAMVTGRPPAREDEQPAEAEAPPRPEPEPQPQKDEGRE